MELYYKGRQVGKTSGWAQPWGVMHLETIEVRRFTGYWSKNPAAEEEESEELSDFDSSTADQEKKSYEAIAKIARWFGLLLSVSIGCWNRERSPFFCKEAHLLAIRDEDFQHKRLVRYYKSLGFKTLRTEAELTSQDQMTWGGRGTLMNILSDDFMKNMTPVIRELAGSKIKAFSSETAQGDARG